MILQSLVQYYEALKQEEKVPVPGWCKAKVSYALELTDNGELCRIIPLKQEVEKGKKKFLEAQQIKVPEMISRSSGIAANFLCDNSTYLLGIDNKGKPQWSKECFLSAREKHLTILKEVDSDAAKAVIRYFETWDPDKADENPAVFAIKEELMAGANLVFYVNGDYVQKDPSIKRAWESYYSESEEGEEGTCLVTGRKAKIARTHGVVKGLQGAQSSGAALVSFNAPAFESYGKEQSNNAPVGNYGVYAYTTALSYLLADKGHMTKIGDGDITVVYWSEKGSECCQDVFANVMEPTIDNLELVDGVFKNLEAGKVVDIPGVTEKIFQEQRFYILGVSPNAARIAVRFFYCDSFGNILKNLKDHYDRMKIAGYEGNIPYMGIWRMLQETVNKKSKDKKTIPSMAGAVYRAIISGERYPSALYQTILGRIRVDQDNSDRGIYKISRGRAAIIKAYLLRNGTCDKEEITVALNEESNNVPYTLGRQFAVLESIQEDASGDINSTIKDRYFNSACATPANIFPVLFKLKNSHIRKIGSKGKTVYYEKLLGALQDKIPAYPKRLTLEEQGMFILGYYHQVQKRYEKNVKEEE